MPKIEQQCCMSDAQSESTYLKGVEIGISGQCGISIGSESGVEKARLGISKIGVGHQ